MSMGGPQNLGGAQFTVTANTASFASGMTRAEQIAQRTAQIMQGQLGTASVSVSKKLDGVTASAGRAAKELQKFGQHGSNNFGFGLMALGNMADDMQYGFRSIVNNIPQVAYLLGGSAGFAGAAAIASVAANQLVQRWGAMSSELQTAWMWGLKENDVLRGQVELLEKLAVRAAKAEDAFDKLMATPSGQQSKQINAIQAAFVEADRGGAAMPMKGLVESVMKDPVLRAEMTDIQKERIATAGMNFPQVVGPGVIPQPGLDAAQLKARQNQVRRQVQEELTDANRKRVRQLMGQAQLAGEDGESARASIARLVDQNPGNFTAQFRGAIQKAAPEEIERLQVEQRQAELLKGIQSILERDERRAHSGAAAAAEGRAAPATKEEVEAMVKEVGLGNKFGPAAIAKVVKELMESGASKNQAREAMGMMPWLMGQNQTMTERMMRSPIGRKMMMGGFPEAKDGPVDAAQAAQMAKQNPLLKRFLLPGTQREFAKQLTGLAQGQAKEALSGITEEAVAKHAKDWGIKDRAGNPNLAAAAQDLLQQRVDAAKKAGPGKPAEDPLVKAVADQLRGAGEAGDPKAIAKEMRRGFQQQVQATMMEQGVNAPMARFMVARQNAQSAFPQLNQPAQWVGLAQKAYNDQLKTLNMGQNGMLPDLARAQLKELMTIRQSLVNMARGAGGKAAIAGFP